MGSYQGELSLAHFNEDYYAETMQEHRSAKNDHVNIDYMKNGAGQRLGVYFSTRYMKDRWLELEAQTRHLTALTMIHQWLSSNGYAPGELPPRVR